MQLQWSNFGPCLDDLASNVRALLSQKEQKLFSLFFEHGELHVFQQQVAERGYRGPPLRYFYYQLWKKKKKKKLFNSVSLGQDRQSLVKYSTLNVFVQATIINSTLFNRCWLRWMKFNMSLPRIAGGDKGEILISKMLMLLSLGSHSSPCVSIVIVEMMMYRFNQIPLKHDRFFKSMETKAWKFRLKNILFQRNVDEFQLYEFCKVRNEKNTFNLPFELRNKRLSLTESTWATIFICSSFIRN